MTAAAGRFPLYLDPVWRKAGRYLARSPESGRRWHRDLAIHVERLNPADGAVRGGPAPER